MTQLAAYWPLRQQIDTPFSQGFTFSVAVNTYTWSFVAYDSPETMNVVIPGTSFSFAVGGTGNTQLTVTAADDLVTVGQGLYYELIGTPSGSGALALLHGPLVFEP